MEGGCADALDVNLVAEYVPPRNLRESEGQHGVISIELRIMGKNLVVSMWYGRGE